MSYFKRLIVLTILLCAVFVVSGTSKAPSQGLNWTGTWEAQDLMGAGKTCTFVLTQVGEKVKGTFTSNLLDGRVDFTAKGQLLGGQMTTIYSGKSPDRVSFRASGDWQSFTGEIVTSTDYGSSHNKWKGKRK